ncbi:acyl-CoA carboxylase epsilon subunit [Streptomyces sp. NPDC049837]|uniref:acyl-CoA carboxylase epsilon subunit n=1 Tax=Streptomyces sp. NPDC049837 TaxID=3155277 RepID=UPI00341659C8
MERGRVNEEELTAVAAALLSVLARNRNAVDVSRGEVSDGSAGWRRWEQTPYRAPHSWR